VTSLPFLPAPDVEAAAVTYLQGLFASAWVGTQRPFGTDWNLPAELLIRVELVDGSPPRAVVLDVWRISVEVWHPDSVVAATIAGEVFGQLNRWSGRHSGVLIYEVEATRPRSVPDPDTSMPRYLLTASGTSRLHTP